MFVSLAGRTRTELDERLIRAMERPAMTLVTLVGLVAALRVLKLPPAADVALTWLSTVAFSLLVLVTVLRLIGGLLDHAQYRAAKRRLSVGAFLPWMRRTLYVLVVVVGVLLIAQSLGANVRAFLTGLGIGGLAVALAAQDTLANIFGSIVIAVDQPFRVGETVQIGPHVGTVEDMGLRSTRLRTPARHLITIPNKTVAAEAISNLTRFTQRRVEQTIRLAQSTTAAQMQGLVKEIRALISAEAEVDPPSVITHFTEFGPASLDIWIAYNTRGPDFLAQLRLKERLNLAIMEAVERQGASFAPTQRVHWSEPPGRAAEAAG
jgi:MscS family membrane protein